MATMKDPTLEKYYPCPYCDEEGHVYTDGTRTITVMDYKLMSGKERGHYRKLDCPYCEGSGEIIEEDFLEYCEGLIDYDADDAF